MKGKAYEKRKEISNIPSVQAASFSILAGNMPCRTL